MTIRRASQWLIILSVVSACSTVPTVPGIVIQTPTPSPTITVAAIPTALPVQPIRGLPAGSQGHPWWNDTVFYEIFVRSFADSNGDGIGDFQGIISKLDYLQSLGISGLWLMPIHPSPTYHGYDVTDYYATNPDYGTLDDFVALLSESHRRGIRVIIDAVFNHTSSESPWFVASQDPASPYRDWYVWSDRDSGTGWHPAASGFFYGFFNDSMPDLNYLHPEVPAKIEDITRFWLKDVGIDGLRLDAAMYILEDGAVTKNTALTHNWYKDFRSYYKSIEPEAMTVGEVWDISPTAAMYAQGDELDLVFNFTLAQAWIIAARTGHASAAADALKVEYGLFPDQQFATFLGNHDQNRVASQLARKADRMRLAAALLLTAPGVPFLYYGEEIGMTGIKPDEAIRTPMQWSNEGQAGFTTAHGAWAAINEDYADGVDVASQDGDPGSLLNWYRALIRARNEHIALRVGEPLIVETSDPGVYGLLRIADDEVALVLMNLGDKDVQFPELSVDPSPLRGSYSIRTILGDVITADVVADSGGAVKFHFPSTTLRAYDIIIVQLQPD